MTRRSNPEETLRDLEESLRRILKDQLRELVRRCAPLAEKADQEQIGSMIEDMISAWISADPSVRRTTLSLGLRKVSSQIAQIKAVQAAKSGLPLVASSSSPKYLEGKKYVALGQKNRNAENLGFDFLGTKSGKPMSFAPRHSVFERAGSKDIAKRLKLASRQVEVARQKLRLSGLDIVFLVGGSFSSSTKVPGKAQAPSKRFD